MLCEKVRWKKIKKTYDFTHVWDRKQKLTNHLTKQTKANSRLQMTEGSVPRGGEGEGEVGKKGSKIWQQKETRL